MYRIVTLIFTVFISGSLLFGQSINFEPMSLEDALTESGKTGKPVLFMAYQSTCSHCEKMLNEIFPDTAVSNFYNANYINVKIDLLDQAMAKKYIKQFYITSFPTFVILNSKGETLYQFVGEFKGSEFVKQGKLALDPQNQIPTNRIAFEKNMADSTACYNYLLVLSRGRLATQGVANSYFAANNKQLETNATNWKILSMSVSDMESEVFKFMLAHRNDFAQVMTAKKVDRKFYLTAAFNLQTPASNNDTTNYFKMRNIAATFGMPIIDSLILVNDLNVYEKNKRWADYINAAKSGAEKYLWNDSNTLRRISDNFYEHSDDKSTLMKGANYAVRSAELKPEYFNNLSAAKIYYKTGYDDLAKKYAKQAIVEGKKKGMNVNEAEIMVNELGG
ncbi:MAG: thioredoxin family protein [Bacteroidetes bacterium]|nr:thioredoxin family protein [Bacteroidota bacterium]